MDIGMIGLGRMGGDMSRRLMRGGHRVVVYDSQPEAVQALVAEGADGASSIEDLAGQLPSPRVAWVMVPSGEPTESTIDALADALSPEDVIIDGGNSNYKDSVRRAASLAERGLFFMDAGTSGGVWGLEEGYSIMVGGDPEVFRRLEPVFQTLAPGSDRGYGRVGPAGSGHFVKMVHNGIEYGLMQAYAEGFELMMAKEDFGLDVAQIAGIWRHGSVVRSWLLDLTAAALDDDPGLETIQAYVEDSGEGRWTVQESVDLNVPTPVISLALQARFRSTTGAALWRQAAGGHAQPVRRSRRQESGVVPYLGSLCGQRLLKKKNKARWKHRALFLLRLKRFAQRRLICPSSRALAFPQRPWGLPACPRSWKPSPGGAGSALAGGPRAGSRLAEWADCGGGARRS